MAGISTRQVCVNDTIHDLAGTFQSPGELWEVMKRSLRQLSMDADAEAVAGLAIVLARDFPSFAEQVSGPASTSVLGDDLSLLFFVADDANQRVACLAGAGDQCSCVHLG